MKRFNILFPVLLFMALPWVIVSCCNSKTELSSNAGLYIDFYDAQYQPQKVEFIGHNKVVEYNGDPIPLNPKDSICNMRIYYIDRNTSTSQNKTVVLSYKCTPQYYDDDNENCRQTGLVIDYDAKVKSTTFQSAYIVRYNTIVPNDQTMLMLTP